VEIYGRRGGGDYRATVVPNLGTRCRWGFSFTPLLHYRGLKNGGRAVEGVRLRSLACWECGFESRGGPGYLSLVSVVFCQVQVSATGRSLFQTSPTECGASECDRGTS
jgi:hypothetical protein